MKTYFRLLLPLCLLSLIFMTCNPSTEEKEAPAMSDDDQALADPVPFLIKGTVKSMKSKQSLSGVNITINGKPQTSSVNGGFSLNYGGTPIIVIYNRNGFERLEHEYINFDQVIDFTVYLEEASTKAKSNKSIRGTVKKAIGGSSTAVKNIKVDAIFNNQSVSTKSNANGFYTLAFTNSTPTFEYEYKIGGINEKIQINQRFGIKDSTDIDIIFDESVGGINIDTLIRQ